MSMHSLLERSARMAFHTDLRAVFHAIGGAQRAFDWILADLDVHGEFTEARAPLLDRDGPDALLLTGDALTAVVEEGGFLQVNWGVLSGFPPGRAPDPGALDPYPFADGNTALWRHGVGVQHPGGRVEIVCWDSSATILLSHEPALAERFRGWFAEAVDLERYNAATAARRPGA